jgi:hypothetical protein
MGLLPAFDRYPEEGRLIGLMVTGWGELEFLLAHCVSQITNDADTTFKVMYRARGESNRVALADSLARSTLTSGKYLDFYDRTIVGLKLCLRIRNNYAHSNWLHDRSRGLLFVALEEIAKSNAIIDLTSLLQHPAPLAHLQRQERYFQFIKDCLGWLNFEAQFVAGRIRQNHFPMPSSMRQPPEKLQPAPSLQ